MTKGFMCVIEGIDGSGGETQTKRLVEFLKSKGKELLVLSYPNPKSLIGKMIYDYLNKKIELSPDMQMTLYERDMALDREKINEALQKGKVVIANRYLHSTLAYQCGAKGIPIEKALELAKKLRLPVPDLVIYLDISVDTSLKRKFGEHNSLDRHEEDKGLLSKVRTSYKELAEKSIFAKEWVVVDGEKSIEEVSTEVQKVVSERL